MLKDQTDHPLHDRIGELTPGQRRVVLALLGDREGRTYRETAELLGIGIGTVYTHLRRVRQQHPDTYRYIMWERSVQLAERHEAALHREAERSRQWHKKQSARRYYRLFGCWPWDRPRRRRQHPTITIIYTRSTP